jgi:polyhydroxybutyrate depolymerase
MERRHGVGWVVVAMGMLAGCPADPAPGDASVMTDAFGDAIDASGGGEIDALGGGETDASWTDASSFDAYGALDALGGGETDASWTDASSFDAYGALDAARPSGACGAPSPAYPAGRTTVATLRHDAVERAFRVHVPPGYDGRSATPLVLVFHGGGGSAEQIELRSSRMNEIADREGFLAVYPDGTGTFRTWNAGGCCGSAVRERVDDVGFVGALIDHLEATLCVDADRVYATGMSNGAMLAHRLACELPDRFAAIAPVAGLEMAPSCPTSGRVAVMQIHGSADGFVPWEGGVGCGPSGVSYPSVPEVMSRWRTRNGCAETASPFAMEGDGTCTRYDDCDADVVLCRIEGGGHSWPGGAPDRDVIPCPADGPQSTTFRASEQMWRFFQAHVRVRP